MRLAKHFVSIAVSLSLLVAYPAMFSSEVQARSKFGASSRSWSSSKSYSKPTQSVWGQRSGGGIFGTGKSKSSAGYSKPSSTGLGGIFGTKSPGKESLSGYSKPAPSLSEPTGTSSGYVKPGTPRSPTAGVSKEEPGTRSTSGYAKPGSREGTPTGTFGGGSTFDKSVSESAAKEQAKRSLSGYRGEQPRSGERRPVDDVISKIDRAHSQPQDAKGRPTTSEKKFSGDSAGWSPRKRSPAGDTGVGSAFDRRVIENSRKQKSKESLAAYKAEQDKFKKPAAEEFNAQKYSGNPVYDKAGATPGFSYNDHYAQRDNYWRDRGVRYPSSMYSGPSSFGLWDAAFLYGMLALASRPNSAAFAYHHQNDPGYQQWRRQAEEQAKTDAELRNQLAEMDKQVAAMKAQGVKVDPSYLPKGVPPEMAVSAAALAAKSNTKPVLRLATGQPGGMYYEFGKLLKKAANDIEVEVITTEGSLQNIDLLKSGKADAALVQSDVLTKMPQKETEQTVLYEEAIQLIANRASGIKSVKDVDARKNYLYVGPKGSGTAATWQGLCEEDSAYAKIPVRYADYKTALARVATDPRALMLFVGGLNSPLINAAEKHAEKTGKLRLAEVDDWDFNDKTDQHGNRIYTFISIGRKTYPYLQKGIIFSGKVETLAVKAVLAVSTDWVKKNGPHVLDSLTIAVKEAQPVMLKLVHGK